MTGKGFLHSTAAVITGVGTLLAALVALGIFLLGEGVLFRGGSGGDAARPGGGAGGGVEFEKKYGRDGTTGFELDGEKDIIRNPGNDGDIVFFEATELVGSFRGNIIAWTGEKAPTRQECADLLETHGRTGTYPIEIGGRFCVRSSGGRTAYLAIISEGQEYQVSVWKQG